MRFRLLVVIAMLCGYSTLTPSIVMAAPAAIGVEITGDQCEIDKLYAAQDPNYVPAPDSCLAPPPASTPTTTTPSVTSQSDEPATATGALKPTVRLGEGADDTAASAVTNTQPNRDDGKKTSGFVPLISTVTPLDFIIALMLTLFLILVDVLIFKARYMTMIVGLLRRKRKQ